MWALEELPVSTPCTFHGLGHPATYSPNWDTLGKGSFNNNYTRIIAVNQDSPWTLSRAVKEIMFNLITKPQNHLSFFHSSVLHMLFPRGKTMERGHSPGRFLIWGNKPTLLITTLNSLNPDYIPEENRTLQLPRKEKNRVSQTLP